MLNADPFLFEVAVDSVPEEPASKRARSCLSGDGGPAVLGTDGSPIGELSVGLGALVNLISLDLSRNLLDGTKHLLNACALHFFLVCTVVMVLFLFLL